MFYFLHYYLLSHVYSITFFTYFIPSSLTLATTLLPNYSSLLCRSLILFLSNSLPLFASLRFCRVLLFYSLFFYFIVLLRNLLLFLLFNPNVPDVHLSIKPFQKLFVVYVLNDLNLLTLIYLSFILTSQPISVIILSYVMLLGIITSQILLPLRIVL